jgi:HPt (histidine-containing phosphotransfer) domain-containing protein
MNEIRKAVKKKKHDPIAETCHKMAAPCKHFHATDLYNAIKQLEESAKNKTDWKTISTHVNQMEIEIEEVNNFFSQTTA